jgi:flagellar M-ring protein FliF
VRALEGELARTIQSIKGIKAARVHIVLPDEGSFRRTRQPPSASVVLRSDVSDGSGSSQAIRHLVAAAVPGMTVDQVTVMNSDGVLLSSTSEGADAAPGRALTLEKQVSQDIRDKITKTLGPYLSARNFQVSVAARLNTDKKQVSETTYNPESRVERSVRVVRENQVSHNTTSQPTTTVERNIPQDRERPADGKQSNEENQKREELTNYEVSSKSTTTVSAGYSIENLSVAVLVNRAGIAGSLGDKATPESIERQLAEVEQLVASAAGLRRDRGDVIKISAVEFTNEGRDLEPVVSPGLGEMLARQSGTAINAATVLVVAFLLIWFGIRPATKALLAPPALPHGAGVDLLPGPELAALPDGEPRVQVGTWEEANLIEDLTSKPRRSPQKRLEQMVQFDEEQAAAILKQWLHRRERV